MKPPILNIEHNVQQLFKQFKSIDWNVTLNHLIEVQNIKPTQLIVAICRCNALLALAFQYPHLSFVPTYEMDVVIHDYIGLVQKIRWSARAAGTPPYFLDGSIAHTPHSEPNGIHWMGTSFLHSPGLGTRGERDRQQWLDMFRQTQLLFEYHFGTGSMGSSPPAACEIFRLDGLH